MTPLIWLVVAAVAAVAAYAIGWPAWSAYRHRDARDLNAERYLAWRGRADRNRPAGLREGMTGAERRRVWIGAALGGVALLGVIAFFAATGSR